MSTKEKQQPEQTEHTAVGIYEALQNENGRLFVTEPVIIPPEHVKYNTYHFFKNHDAVLYVAPVNPITDINEINAFMASLTPEIPQTRREPTRRINNTHISFGYAQYDKSLVRFAPTPEWAEDLRTRHLAIQERIKNRADSGEGEMGSILTDPYLTGTFPSET